MGKALALREIQKIESDILSHIDIFCKEHNIKYYLTYGTLIGAIRHKGFIPWDDDIDICMLRDDYNKFIEEYGRNNDEPYQILSIYNDPLYYYDTARVVDTRTTICIDGLIHNPSEGLWIDIFPLDNIPKYNIFLRGLVFFLTACRVLSVYTRYPSNKHSLIFYPIWYISKKIGPRFFLNIIERIVSRKGNSGVVGYFCSEMWPRDWIKKEWCENPVQVLFEGKQYPTFSHYDDILNSIYGDYMTLPPEEKRTPHPIKAYWK